MGRVRVIISCQRVTFVGLSSIVLLQHALETSKLNLLQRLEAMACPTILSIQFTKIARAIVWKQSYQKTRLIICQAHLLVDLPTIPLMYNLVLWNNFLKKKKKKKNCYLPTRLSCRGTETENLHKKCRCDVLKYQHQERSRQINILTFYHIFE